MFAQPLTFYSVQCVKSAGYVVFLHDHFNKNIVSSCSVNSYGQLNFLINPELADLYFQICWISPPGKIIRWHPYHKSAFKIYIHPHFNNAITYFCSSTSRNVFFDQPSVPENAIPACSINHCSCSSKYSRYVSGTGIQSIWLWQSLFNLALRSILRVIVLFDMWIFQYKHGELLQFFPEFYTQFEWRSHSSRHHSTSTKIIDMTFHSLQYRYRNTQSHH